MLALIKVFGNNCYRIQSQSTYFQKFPWGTCPSGPLRFKLACNRKFGNLSPKFLEPPLTMAAYELLGITHLLVFCNFCIYLFYPELLLSLPFIDMLNHLP